MLSERLKLLSLGKIAKAYSNLEAIMTEYHITDELIVAKIRETQEKMRELQNIVMK